MPTATRRNSATNVVRAAAEQADALVQGRRQFCVPAEQQPTGGAAT
jgi:hypothetical protein